MESQSNHRHDEEEEEDSKSLLYSDEDQAEDESTLGTGRSYECVFCKRGFTTAQALGGHMNIHRKERANKPRPTSAPLLPTNSTGIKPSSADHHEHVIRSYRSLQTYPGGPHFSTSPDPDPDHHVNYRSTFIPTWTFIGTDDDCRRSGSGLRLGIGPSSSVPDDDDDDDDHRKKENGRRSNNGTATAGTNGEGDGLDLELRLGHDP